jgi:hypothetical protein
MFAIIHNDWLSSQPPSKESHDYRPYKNHTFNHETKPSLIFLLAQEAIYLGLGGSVELLQSFEHPLML